MTERALVEEFTFQRLKTIGAAYGVAVKTSIFDVGKGEIYPFLYFRHVTGVDRNAVGPGRRLFSAPLYEIGVVHDGAGLGAVFDTSAGSVPLLTILGEIDDVFQNYSTPTQVTGGVVLSCQREMEDGLAERAPDGSVHRREYGLYRFHARKD